MFVRENEEGEDEYVFEPGKLAENHKRNIEAVRRACCLGISPVIVDNTNMKLWDMKEYVLAGDEYLFTILISNTKM